MLYSHIVIQTVKCLKTTVISHITSLIRS